MLSGAAAAGALGPRTPALAGASVLLYWAGMAANDWADRRLDAVERPERPIPSGRVRPSVALGVASGLTAAGLAVATAAGGVARRPSRCRSRPRSGGTTCGRRTPPPARR
ncbi:UbiA family prenyltransferase [Micromonospora sp. BRA006-A]|nr:UbiA family prenyltransferase [Micromonospora sp. BRA006-A]